MSELIPYSELPSDNKGGARPGAGRKKNCGLSILEHLNQFADEGLTEARLREISRGKREPWTRRTAAERALRSIEVADMADFQPVVKGSSELEELRASGVDTSLIKKITPNEFGAAVELHDRSDGAFDRIMDRTHGKPDQAVSVRVQLPSVVAFIFPQLPDPSRLLDILPQMPLLDENSTLPDKVDATDAPG